MTVDPRKVFTDPRYFLALGFGSGLAPRAPGTAGTLAAVPCFLVLDLMHPLAYVAFVTAAFGLGVWVCDRVAAELGVEDPGMIVFDEFVGLWAGLFMLPHGWYWLPIGFALFRAFDIFKPWPVSFLDTHVKGGLGIMADDLAAGVYTFLTLQAASFLVTQLIPGHP